MKNEQHYFENNFARVSPAKMMNKNYYLPATVCALAVCLALCFAVAAWNSPTETPPDSNVAAPINTGGEAQYKTGGLGVKIGGAVTYWISQIGDKLAFKTGDDFATAVETVNINTDGRIGNVAAPIDDKDAVNKAYLDAQAGGGGTGYGTCDGTMLAIKFTAATYTGNLGGIAGANAKCAAEYPGYHFCQESEVRNFGRQGCLPAPIQYYSVNGRIDNTSSNCEGWTVTQKATCSYPPCPPGYYRYTPLSSLTLMNYQYDDETGGYVSGIWTVENYYAGCASNYSLACCKEI